MKKLPFKKEFVESVKNGEKRFTSRWGGVDLLVGDEVYAIMVDGITPAPLDNPLFNVFATLKITSIESKFWFQFTDDDARDCGVARRWYLKGKSKVSGMNRITKIGFDVVEAME